jgi:hypothetical protein
MNRLAISADRFQREKVPMNSTTMTLLIISAQPMQNAIAALVSRARRARCCSACRREFAFKLARAVDDARQPAGQHTKHRANAAQ